MVSNARPTDTAAEDAAAPTEYQLKAAVLFNLVKFTTWPSAAFKTPASPLVIGVYGVDPFDGALELITRGAVINGRALEIRAVSNSEAAASCHVLFLVAAESAKLRSILDALRNRPALTVGDSSRFCQNGGMVNLGLGADGKPRLEINADAARACGLQLSSRLLSLKSVRLQASEPVGP